MTEREIILLGLKSEEIKEELLKKLLSIDQNFHKSFSEVLKLKYPSIFEDIDDTDLMVILTRSKRGNKKRKAEESDSCSSSSA